MVQMNWFAGQKLRHRCRGQMYGHQGGKAAGGGVGGGMNWEVGIDMYTLMCIKLMTNKNLLYKKIKLKKKTFLAVVGDLHIVITPYVLEIYKSGTSNQETHHLPL